MGEIESPKAVSDLYAPTSLEVGKFYYFVINFKKNIMMMLLKILN